MYLRAKKSYFGSTYFCEWQVFENFELINFNPKEKIKKTVESRDIRLMLLSRSTKRQAGHDGKTVNDWFQKKAELTNIFWAYFFHMFIIRKYEFCANLTCIYFRECCLKRKLCVYLILQNRPKFVKFAKKYTREN